MRYINVKRKYLKTFRAMARFVAIALMAFLYLHYFSHQSWGYFTVEPRQPLFNIYTLNKNVPGKTVIKNNASYGMGVSRKGIILFNELSEIISRNKNLVWKKYKGDSLQHIDMNDVSIVNYDDLRVGRGVFFITRTERATFTAIRNNTNFIPESYYALVDIK